MQRYFVSLNNENFIFKEDDIFHITRVMRMKIGDFIEVVSEGKVYLVKIISLSPFAVKKEKILEENHENTCFYRLFLCLLKGEKNDLVIQKVIELGAKDIVLVNSSRSISRIDDNKKESKLIRYNKIVKEALEQSKRSYEAKVSDIISFDEIFNYYGDINLIPYECSSKNSEDLIVFLTNLDNKTINVIVGPEGGFSKNEVGLAIRNGYNEVSLGKRILRSETAAIFISSLISFYAK